MLKSLRPVPTGGIQHMCSLSHPISSRSNSKDKPKSQRPWRRLENKQNLKVAWLGSVPSHMDYNHPQNLLYVVQEHESMCQRCFDIAEIGLWGQNPPQCWLSNNSRGLVPMGEVNLQRFLLLGTMEIKKLVGTLRKSWENSQMAKVWFLPFSLKIKIIQKEKVNFLNIWVYDYCYVNKCLLPLTSSLIYVVYKSVFYIKVTVCYYEQELKSDQLVCIFLCMSNAQSF